ncbi:hypothetical protein [Pseudobacillus badius]|uniref:hypothetical protein n=1 Tax=Bacillus badius TaxID=1455 RepID=UPI0007B096AE|nr:hypothetical protein [Bacillus badius]KZN99712.1 hypothetical protein A4244_17090 [Bacillus badius]MED0666497.1 hypothetical protein [Bacillus badius]OCS85816.1 hypothetical protein A6M11_17105 [Bacillus badius]OVE51826.1 hypothetical protein B1A98_09725 [Bacillus badius]TDW03252.1 hypothetical protein B0G66_104158 [Bacillus badius]
MRFLVEYKDFKNKEAKSASLDLLDTFLNEQLIGKFHGTAFECILVRFINHPPQTRKLKLKTRYKTMAEVEVAMDFADSRKLNMKDFQTALLKVEEAIHKVRLIESRSPADYHEEQLLDDYKASLTFIPKDLKELKAYAQKEKEITFHNRVKRADCFMYSRSINPQPLTTRLIGVRVDGPQNCLAPFDYIYSELFSHLLRRADIKLPGYDEIYVSIGETLEDAKQEIAIDGWCQYTYSAIDLIDYHLRDQEEKAQLVFASICDGLRLIADFDHLEKEKIEKVIHFIQEKGTDIDLVYMFKQNKNYLAEIIYTIPKDHLTKAEYKLQLTDLRSSQSKVVPINFIHTFWAPYSFGQLLIQKEEIVIKGRKSMRAEISRKADKLPDEYRFNITDIMNQDAIGKSPSHP